MTPIFHHYSVVLHFSHSLAVFNGCSSPLPLQHSFSLCLCLHNCFKLSLYFGLSLSFTIYPQCSNGSLFFALSVSLVLRRHGVRTYFSLSFTSLFFTSLSFTSLSFMFSLSLSNQLLSLSLSLSRFSLSPFLSLIKFSLSVSKPARVNFAFVKHFCNQNLKTAVSRQICQNLVKFFC